MGLLLLICMATSQALTCGMGIPIRYSCHKLSGLPMCECPAGTGFIGENHCYLRNEKNQCVCYEPGMIVVGSCVRSASNETQANATQAAKDQTRASG